MDLTILLSKVFGVYFLIAAIMVFANRKALMLGVEAMFKERFAQLLAAMISILGGLLLINLHSLWSTIPEVVISFIGWLLLIKGLLYAFLPHVQITKLVAFFSERNWYTMDGVLALIVGIYLTGFGYGLW